MECETCGGKAKLQCPKCHSGYYCDRKCRKWNSGKHALICDYWSGNDGAERRDVLWHNMTKIPAQAPVIQCVEVEKLWPTPPKSKFHITRDPEGNSVVHDVVRRGDMATLQRMLEEGVYVDLRNKKGHTPLYVALTAPVRKGEGERLKRKRMVVMLGSFGATENVGVKGEVAQTIATMSGMEDMLPALHGNSGFRCLRYLESKMWTSQLCKKTVKKLVHKLADVRWRFLTLWWLQKHAKARNPSFAPHPHLLDAISEDPSTVELQRLFTDTEERHKSFMRALNKAVDSGSL